MWPTQFIIQHQASPFLTYLWSGLHMTPWTTDYKHFHHWWSTRWIIHHGWRWMGRRVEQTDGWTDDPRTTKDFRRKSVHRGLVQIDHHFEGQCRWLNEIQKKHIYSLSRAPPDGRSPDDENMMNLCWSFRPMSWLKYWSLRLKCMVFTLSQLIILCKHK